MASEECFTLLELINSIEALDANRFNFAQLHWLLEKVQSNLSQKQQQQSLKVRFGHHHSMNFATSDIQNIRYQDEQGTHSLKIKTTFLGLTGSNSPLPLTFSEQVTEAEREEQFELGAFYDIFHHRLINLLGQLRNKYQWASRFESSHSDSITSKILNLIGPKFSADSPFDDTIRLALGHLLSGTRRTPARLCAILHQLFPGVRFHVLHNLKQKTFIPLDQQIRLGRVRSKLGIDFCIGQYIIDRGGLFRLIADLPVDGSQNCLLEDVESQALLASVISEFAQGYLDAELNIRFSPGEQQGMRLGDYQTSRLGKNCRIVSSHRQLETLSFKVKEAQLLRISERESN